MVLVLLYRMVTVIFLLDKIHKNKWCCGCSVWAGEAFWEVVDSVSGVPRFTLWRCSLHKVCPFSEISWMVRALKFLTLVFGLFLFCAFCTITYNFVFGLVSHCWTAVTDFSGTNLLQSGLSNFLSTKKGTERFVQSKLRIGQVEFLSFSNVSFFLNFLPSS